ncbi:amidase [Oligoflexus tunisiensis]|uniref:amidase n=1 Tax=Oligoflexus tunisiensis TaxID=708132 RepID=UPI00114D2EBA|nr:amidase [Oligoflexus tunisiensis]
MLKSKDRRAPSSHYAITEVPSPALAGPQLMAFIKLLESSRLARKSLLNVNNMDVLHALTLAEAPSLLPQPTPAQAEFEIQKQEQWKDERMDAPFADSEFQTYIKRYEARKLTPLDVAQTVLRQIRESNEEPEPLKAIIAVHEDCLMRDAAASSKRYQEGQPLSPLDGIPIAVKSEIFVKHLSSQAGTSFLQVPRDHAEATIVMRLRKAGALIVGLTNMHEIGIGVTGANPHYGVARNPYDRKRHTGGSSSGSAAAVAAGLVPMAIGTDGGGSIRIPSSLCGTVGLKPSFSRLSSHGMFPTAVSVCQAGPIARRAVDCALAYQIMAGADPLDGRTQLQPPPSLRGLSQLKDLSDLTVGVYDSWFEHADPEVVGLCHNLLVALQNRGLNVVPIELPELEEARVAHFITIAAEMYSYMKPYMARHRNELAPTTRFALALGSELSSTDYLQAQRVRHRSMRRLDDIFRRVDFIVSPTCATPAPLIQGHNAYRDVLDTVLMGRLMRFAQLFNLTGHPAISFPAGYTTQGLPVGIQFAGRWWAEADLLRIARVGDELVERRRPASFWAAF